MTPGLRKLALSAHITTSVGWLGAVAAFLPLAIIGLTSQDRLLVRGVYLAMELTTSFAILPLCLASLLTGLVSSLGTEWGLFRHYWVVLKLLTTLLSTIILLVHMQPIRHLAGVATTTVVSSDLYRMQFQIMVASAAALLALLALTALSVYKPRGLTVYGWRKQYKQRPAPIGNATSQ